MLRVEHLGMTYGEGENAVQAIGDVDLEVAEKEFVKGVCSLHRYPSCVVLSDYPTGRFIPVRRVNAARA